MAQPLKPDTAPRVDLSYSLPWLPDSNRLRLSSVGAMRRSLERSDAYEIECRFVHDGVVPMNFSAWAPFEQLSLLREGAVFEDHVLVGRSERHSQRQATGLKMAGTSPVRDFFGRLTSMNERKVGQEVWNERHLFPLYCFGNVDGRPYMIPSAEILRFYFGALSLTAASFMEIATDGEPAASLIDREHTRFLEPGVLQIAPREGLADRGSALQLALLLMSPDLRAMWWQVAQGFILAGARGEDKYFPAAVLAPGRHSFSVLGERQLVESEKYDINPDQVFKVSSILSDYRPAPFRRLIIKLPQGLTEHDLDRLEDDPPEAHARFSTIVAPNAPIENRRRPGRQVARLSPHHESLRRAFPGLGRVEIDYDLPRTMRRTPANTEWRQRIVEELSALPLGRSNPGVGRVLFRPSPTYAPPEVSAVPTRLLFEQSEFELGVFRPVVAQTLAFPLPAFIGAFAKLRRERSGSLVGQITELAASDEVMLLQAPSSWGPAARGRSFGVGVIEVEDRAVYAFEMLRRNRTERISLFLVMRADGRPMSPANISAVARHAIEHISSRGSKADIGPRGIWPSPAQFRDIHGRVVPHTIRRRLAGLLAEELHELARSLALPEVVMRAVA